MIVKYLFLAASAVATAVLVWMVIAMTNGEPESAPMRTATSRKVSARILGRAEDIMGIEVPKGLSEESSTYLHASEPSETTVQLPGGRVVQTWSKLTSVNVDHGVVVDVHLLPLSHAVSFREAIADLRRLLGEMQIEPDERMRNQMAKWPDDNGGDFTYRTEVKLSDTVTFLVKVRSADDGKRFLVLTFAADGPARRTAVTDGKLKAAPTAPDKVPVAQPDQILTDK